jgi:hypothetical protein
VIAEDALKIAALECAAQVSQGTGSSGEHVIARAQMFLAFLTVRKLRASFSAYTGNQRTGTFTKSKIQFDSEGDAVAVTMDDEGTGTLSVAPEDAKNQLASDTLTWAQVDTPAGATASGTAGSVLTITPDSTTLNVAVSAVAPGTSVVTGTDPAGNTVSETFQVTASGVTQLVPTWTPGPEQNA